MVLSKAELIASLKQEVRILVHLCGKVDRARIDYRPTPKQRSTIELLRYLTIMGPELAMAVRSGTFDPAAWTAAEEAAKTRDFDGTVAVLAAQAGVYDEILGPMSDADFRSEIEMFGQRASRGYFIVNFVLSGHAAYRTQLFCYLKSCGRDELGTMNLWAGVDAPAGQP